MCFVLSLELVFTLNANYIFNGQPIGLDWFGLVYVIEFENVGEASSVALILEIGLVYYYLYA